MPRGFARSLAILSYSNTTASFPGMGRKRRRTPLRTATGVPASTRTLFGAAINGFPYGRGGLRWTLFPHSRQRARNMGTPYRPRVRPHHRKSHVPALTSHAPSARARRSRGPGSDAQIQQPCVANRYVMQHTAESAWCHPSRRLSRAFLHSALPWPAIWRRRRPVRGRNRCARKEFVETTVTAC